MRHQGTITHWKDEKGFGFITPNGGGNQVFVHITSFANRQRRPVGNEIVTYEFKTDPKGRAQAQKVSFADERVPPTISSGYNNGPLMLAASFLFFVLAATLAGKIPFAVLWIYLMASTITFVVYALDKSAARNDRWRIQESTLHLFELIGGWPGAYHYLDDWTDRDGNSNIEEHLLTAYLTKRKYTPAQISIAIHKLRTEADNHNRGLYGNNKAVYNLLKKVR